MRRKSPPKSQRQLGHPAASRAQELSFGVLRAAAVIRRAVERALTGSGLSGAQYQVLRVLQLAGADGLPTLAVRDRLVDAAPGVTRLLERLARTGLVVRERTARDQRQVICRLTAAGRAALTSVEPGVHAAVERAGARLTGAEQRACIRLLDTLRRGASDPG